MGALGVHTVLLATAPATAVQGQVLHRDRVRLQQRGCKVHGRLHFKIYHDSRQSFINTNTIVTKILDKRSKNKLLTNRVLVLDIVGCVAAGPQHGPVLVARAALARHRSVQRGVQLARAVRSGVACSYSLNQGAIIAKI